MNIDPSNKAQEQEEQNQQTTTTTTTGAATTSTPTTTTTSATATTTTVLALLISPSSPSSTSTVSPTASSISKNSSTDEVDETTAEAEPPQLEAKGSKPAAADRGQDEQRRQQLVFEQREDEDVHRNNSEQRTGTEQPFGVDCRGPTGRPVEPNVTMTLDVTNTTTTTLLGQCTPEKVTTELRTLELAATAVVPARPTLESEANGDSNSSKEENDTLPSSAIEVEPARELIAEALSPPKTPQPSLSSSSSSSSSTSSTPSVGEERRLPVVPEEDSYTEDLPAGECCYRQPLATSNNNPALVLEVDLTSGDSGAGGCINDRYNNNSKRSDSNFQIVLGDSTQTKVTNRNDDDHETVAA
uniref:Uncharacterized protein n=1 Tax=Anopheles maculatus TaxID=74869 RepID=A0A182SC60_9DIPT